MRSVVAGRAKARRIEQVDGIAVGVSVWRHRQRHRWVDRHELCRRRLVVTGTQVVDARFTVNDSNPLPPVSRQFALAPDEGDQDGAHDLKNEVAVVGA